MKITKFSELVTQHEKLKEQVNIAQIKEILNVINKLTHGSFYKLIKDILWKKK